MSEILASLLITVVSVAIAFGVLLLLDVWFIHHSSLEHLIEAGRIPGGTPRTWQCPFWRCLRGIQAGSDPAITALARQHLIENHMGTP